MPGKEEAVTQTCERTISERPLAPKQWISSFTDDDDDPLPPATATGPPPTLEELHPPDFTER